MTYVNPLSGKLDLQTDDLKREAKLVRLLEDMKEKILTPLEVPFTWHVNDGDLTVEEALGSDWSTWPEFGSRSVWGKKQGHTWFAAEVIVPEEAAGKTPVIRFTSQWQHRPGSTDPQCLAYLDGAIVQALDGNHTELVVARDAVPGTRRVLHVDAFTFFDRPLAGFQVEFFLRNERAEQLYFDLTTPFEVATYLPQNDARRHAILDLVERSLRALDRRDGYTSAFEASLAEAEALAREIYALVDTEVQPTISAVGHTHLDVAWLWRVLHTREKTGRSFATALSLIEEYPAFVFMYNQSVLFNFLKSDYAELWARLKEKVRSRQFEIEGAMWVEPDANIISGESFVRQIMRGRRFHRQEFGVTPKSVWLPDTFGYSANMPQIMARSGLDYFVTSKLSWNDTDRHPFDTFFWRGIDGTETKAQLITTQRMESEQIFTTYNSDLSVSEVMGAWKRYEPKKANDEVLICYGYGDGGGGPTRAMIERGIRLQRGIPGAPKVKLEGILPFLERLGNRMEAEPGRFPVWNGELYLQYHRGTLTTVARNKASNRKAERLMREVEFLNAMAFARAGVAYPAKTIDALWEIVLINQFHDILPGTSIAEVYEDSDAEYGNLFSRITSEDGPRHLALAAAARTDGKTLLVMNATSQKRENELTVIGTDAHLEGAALVQENAAHPVQKLMRPDGSIVFAAPATAPSLGWAEAALVRAVTVPESGLSVSTTLLENGLVRVVFDERGEIVSVFDKERGRELIAPGAAANRLVAYEDKPMRYEAWDIDHYFEEQYWPLADCPVTVEVVETGPYRAAVRIERTYQNSKIVQIVSLQENARFVEFDTFIDWHEKQTVLKACFPFDLNSSEVRAEIQFGHVTRPTHRNTSWDQARFEASMHRWVDLSEADFGAALLNDCKYGYDAVEQQVRLTLLRGSTKPAPEPDKGPNHMRYALMIHGGIGDLHEVHRAAERFNNAMVPVGETGRIGDGFPDVAGSFSFASVDANNLTIETVKKAEASDHIVLRVFEHANRRAKGRITFGLPVKSVRYTNLMEEEEGDLLSLQGNAAHIELRPFEIATLLVETQS